MRQNTNAQTNSKRDLHKILARYAWFYRPLIYVGIYGIWIWTFRLLALSFITYFTNSPTVHFQDINEAFSSNEVTLMGLSTFLFVGLLHWLHPLTSNRLEDVISRERIEKDFFPGFVRGAFTAGGLVLIFVLAELYRYLGYFIQFDEAPLALSNIILRIVAVGALVYGEEFLFRYKLPSHLKDSLPSFLTPLWIGLLYCGIKALQFNLGFMHLITLFLVSVALSLRANPMGSFARGAGLWAAILIVFNPLLSLPIFGSDFAGVLLIKYQSASQALTKTLAPTLNWSLPGQDENLTFGTRLLTGGAGGPISSFVFQLLLILDIGRSILRRKKTVRRT